MGSNEMTGCSTLPSIVTAVTSHSITQQREARILPAYVLANFVHDEMAAI